MNVVRVKDGVQFAVISPAGFELLRAITEATAKISHDLTITSGTDGAHSGSNDPHHSGSAYDVRSQDLPDAQLALEAIMDGLGVPNPGSGGLVTQDFFGWLEDAGTPNEHIHVQLRHSVIYPPQPPLGVDEATQV